VLWQDGAEDVLLVGIGPMTQLAVEVAERLRAQGIGATVVDPRWVVPVQPSIVKLAAAHRLVITIEDGIRVGGVGTRVRQVLREAGVDTAVDELGLPDAFIDHASREQILEDAGLSAAKIAQDVVAQVLGTRIPIARPSTDTGAIWTVRAAPTAPNTPTTATRGLNPVSRGAGDPPPRSGDHVDSAFGRPAIGRRPSRPRTPR
jgi:1-deoxy-D-xylulose-5-phosphate synthase